MRMVRDHNETAVAHYVVHKFSSRELQTNRSAPYYPHDPGIVSQLRLQSNSKSAFYVSATVSRERSPSREYRAQVVSQACGS
jgi:hypothetical protein